MAEDTLYVDPPKLRTGGSALMGIGEGITGEFSAVSNGSDGTASLSSDWAVIRTVSTLQTLWSNYLNSLGTRVNDNGERIRTIADVFQTRDEEAAAELGITLPDPAHIRLL